MKSRIFAFLAIALILFTSMTFVGGCGSKPNFKETNCIASPSSLYVGDTTTISADISNAGASGTYTAICKVDGTTIGTKDVVIASKSIQTVNFTYTATTQGTFTISIGKATSTFGVLNTTTTPGNTTGYWDVKYNVVGGKVTLNYSLSKGTAYHKDLILAKGDGVVTMRINKTVVNGARAVTLPKEGWQIKGIDVEDISPGADMNMVFSLETDATGTLYVESGKGDVDMSSVSSTGRTPIQANTFGDGTKDPAGSMLMPTLLKGFAKVSVGTDVILSFGLTFTTGHTVNTVVMNKSKFNGATLSSDGVAFAKTGTLTVGGQKLPDYVGTAGTITTTGTGDCLGLTLVGLPIDFQAEIKLMLEPESVK